MSILDRCKALFETARHGQTRLPTRVMVPPDHVDQPARLGPALSADTHYFQVRVNEMFLAHAREWYAQYDPLVFVGSEFIYDKVEMAVPVVVGPSLIERFGKKQQIPTGFVFEDARVAGLHPYRGGRLTVTVMLFRVQRVNGAREILKVVDSTAGALDFSTAVGTYTRVAGAVLDGLDALLGLGATVPVLGYRREMDPDAGDPMAGAYYALIDSPEDQVDPNSLWVREKRLVQGTTRDGAKPFRSADYLLYSLVSSPERTDERMLPFYPLWERAQEEAAVPTEEAWKSAKANLLSLYQSMLLSPDLIRTHADALAQEYALRMKEQHTTAVGLGNLGGERSASLERPRLSDRVRTESVKLLSL